MVMRKKGLNLVLAACFIIVGKGGLAVGQTHPVIKNPCDFGAKADGRTLDTKAIQKAIDACSEAGGGTVLLDKGVFLSGTIRLRSGVTLTVGGRAVLRGSADIRDYEDIHTAVRHVYSEAPFTCLIYAERASGLALTGDGVIDGQGSLFLTGKEAFEDKRPFLIRFAECRDVRVSGLMLMYSGLWMAHWLACDNVLIEGVTVRNRIRENRDGFDIDSCDGVVIRDCNLYTGDDGICLKATVAERPCRNVLVTDCVVSAQPSALKLGTDSQGGFENVTFQRCHLYDSRDGIAVINVDGGVCRNIRASDITMRNVIAPLFVRLGNRARPVPGGPTPGVGTMRDIMFSDIRAEGAGKIGCAITGIPGHPVEGLTLSNVWIRVSGGGSEKDAVRVIPEYEEKYPRGNMFGLLPAFGLYVRHADGVTLDEVSLTADQPDARPAIVTDDVRELKRSGTTPEPVDGRGASQR